MSPTAFGPDVRPKAPASEKLYSAFADRFRLFWIANPGASGLAVLPISLTWRALAPFKGWRRRRSKNPPNFLNRAGHPPAARLWGHSWLAPPFGGEQEKFQTLGLGTVV